MIRRIAMIAVYLASTAIVALIIWRIVVDEKNGRVLWTFSDSHGIHTGDLPALIIGIPLILMMLAGIIRELTHLRRARHNHTHREANLPLPHDHPG